MVRDDEEEEEVAIGVEENDDGIRTRLETCERIPRPTLDTRDVTRILYLTLTEKINFYVIKKKVKPPPESTEKKLYNGCAFYFLVKNSFFLRSLEFILLFFDTLLICFSCR